MSSNVALARALDGRLSAINRHRMRDVLEGLVRVVFAFLLLNGVNALAEEQHLRIAGTAGDFLEDDPVGRLKVFVYDLPVKYNKEWIETDARCLNRMFALEQYMHDFLISSPVQTLNPEEANWFFAPVHTSCDLTHNGLPLPFKSPHMMRSAIRYISSTLPYWNRTEGADHFLVVPHDFGACFHYREEKAIEMDILHLLSRATLVQTFGQRYHPCLKDGSIVVSPYAPPSKLQSRFIPPSSPRSIFVYFRGFFYDRGNDPEGGPAIMHGVRGQQFGRTSKAIDNPLFDISTEQPVTYYDDLPAKKQTGAAFTIPHYAVKRWNSVRSFVSSVTMEALWRRCAYAVLAALGQTFLSVVAMECWQFTYAVLFLCVLATIGQKLYITWLSDFSMEVLLCQLALIGGWLAPKCLSSLDFLNKLFRKGLIQEDLKKARDYIGELRKYHEQMDGPAPGNWRPLVSAEEDRG